MIRQVGNERLMIFWHASGMGWIICWKQGVEKTMEIASAYKTDIANLHGPLGIPWTWAPQGMSVRRILDCKLFAEDLVVGHRDRRGRGNLSTLVVKLGMQLALAASANLSNCLWNLRARVRNFKFGQEFGVEFQFRRRYVKINSG
jgi:hypothetical protein